MCSVRRYYIFISHAWNFDEYDRIKHFLNISPDFVYTNLSVPAQKALNVMKNSELKKAIEWRIRFSQIVLVPIGMEINYRKFIQFEIETAKNLEKPIIGILPRGMKQIPKKITESAWEIVGWRGKSIISAIERNVYLRYGN